MPLVGAQRRARRADAHARRAAHDAAAMPRYGDVVEDVARFLASAHAACEAAGIARATHRRRSRHRLRQERGRRISQLLRRIARLGDAAIPSWSAVAQELHRPRRAAMSRRNSASPARRRRAVGARAAAPDRTGSRRRRRRARRSPFPCDPDAQTRRGSQKRHDPQTLRHRRRPRPANSEPMTAEIAMRIGMAAGPRASTAATIAIAS